MRAVRVEEEDTLAYQSEIQPRAGVQRADLRQKVWAAAARMPARPRRLLLRHELEGLSYAQIGAAMGMSTEKVRRQLHRARALFRKKYAGYMAAREKRIKCRRLGDLLSGYYDGELRGMQRRRVADHLALCPDCQGAQERLASTSELLATLAPTPAPPGLADKLFTSTVKAGAVPAAGSGGAIWRLALMLLIGGGFIGGVAYLAAKVWDDGGGSSAPVVASSSTPTPRVTPRASPTRAATVFAVLTPAAAPTRQEAITVTATATAEGRATPVVPPPVGPSPSPDITSELPPSPTASMPPPSPTASMPPPSPTPPPTPTREPTPSPTPEPLPGGVSGLATCQGQAASGAQVSISGPYPGGGSGWAGATGPDGSFSTDLVLVAGSYVVSISWSGGIFDSAIAAVPHGGYAYVAVECTAVIGPSYW
jgi:hypothetical protein